MELHSDSSRNAFLFLARFRCHLIFRGPLQTRIADGLQTQDFFCQMFAEFHFSGQGDIPDCRCNEVAFRGEEGGGSPPDTDFAKSICRCIAPATVSFCLRGQGKGGGSSSCSEKPDCYRQCVYSEVEMKKESARNTKILWHWSARAHPVGDLTSGLVLLPHGGTRWRGARRARSPWRSARFPTV